MHERTGSDETSGDETGSGETGSDRTGTGREPEIRAAGFRLFDRGAHLAEWHPPKAARPVLFSGSLATIGEGRAWRGGVPLCVPWFGSGPDGRRSPAHGPARTALWRRLPAGAGETRHRLVLNRDATGGSATIELLAGTRRGDEELDSTLEIRNAGLAPVVVEAALHSYLAVSDVREVRLRGLEHAPFLDKTTGRREPAAPGIPLGGAVDRIYDSSDEPLELHDPGWERVLRIERAGSSRVVVWNPGPDGGPADLAPGEWLDFLCVEAAAVGDGSLHLAPGEAHLLRSRLRLG